MMTTTRRQQRPAFREPWTFGAKAYTEADTFEALEAGMRRKRKGRTVLMPMSAVGDLACCKCGIALREPYPVNDGAPRSDWHTDTTGRVAYSPRTRRVVPVHYYCAWRAVILDTVALGRAMQIDALRARSSR